jgi:hypothetical protein
MQPISREVVMRLRLFTRPSPALTLDPRSVSVSEKEILDDLLYPARAPRRSSRARG